MYVLKFIGKREWGLAALALLAIVSQVFFDLRLPDYMQDITAVIVKPNAEMSEVLREGAKMLGCALASMGLAVVTGFCLAMIGATISMRMRAAVFHSSMDFSLEQAHQFSNASLITRSTNDITQIQMFVVMGVQMAVKSPIMAVWAMTKIAGKNGTWTAATAVAVGVLVLILAVVMARVMPRMMRMQRITDDLNRVTREHLTGLRVIRAYNAQGFHQGRFEKTNTELTRNNLQIFNAMAFLMPALNVVMSGLSLSIYALGAVMINDSADIAKRMDLFSQMLVFSAYAMQVVAAFMMFTMVFVFLPRARVSYRRVREVLTSKNTMPQGSATSGLEGSENRGRVEFKNVSFAYPGAEEAALHNISFTAEPGQTLAIIGATGSGKTSLVNLIDRFYDVSEGAVLVDGRDVREWDENALRQRIAYATQKATLFSGTLASNIAFGTPAVPLDAAGVVRAAETARASEFIMAKEDGYSGHVAQGGTNFSGGQKQRVSIARTIARGAEIMIFDDSFSALDYQTDRDVRQALAQNNKEATRIIVAQRIGTVRSADKILVLDHGRLVGQGTHEELMAENPVYREIAFSQLSEEELA